MAEIDVLIPVYNAEATLAQSLDSILAQDFDDLRVVVVDDGSTDGSAAMLAAIGDPRLAVFRTENQGVARALNFGLSKCEAPFIARFDADDIAYPNRLVAQHAYLSAHRDCVAVGCDVDHIDQAGKALHGHPKPGDPGEADADWAPAREPYIIHPFLMARREAVMQAGGYRVLRTSQDSDLYWRLGGLGRLHNLAATLGQYRIHGNSVSGARIQQGRVMALCSQLAALSAQRRKASKQDLDFPILHPMFEDPITTLEDLATAFANRVADEETRWFRLALGAKLMELTTYRPYELELSDCRFIARARRDLDSLAPANRTQFDWYVSVIGSRLLRAGRIAEATALTGAARLPKTLLRAAAHVTGLKRSIS
ncbi:MAG: glycosyltransferase [Pseudomonadota bacterium]